MVRGAAGSGPEPGPGPEPFPRFAGPQGGRPRGVLALDIDGTLLRSDGTVSPRNQAAVARCLDAGIVVVLATGRTLVSASQYFRYWPGRPLWVIAGNGAVIRPSWSVRPLQERLIPLPLARELARWADRERLYLKAYVDDRLFVSQVTEETLSFSRIHRVPYVRVHSLPEALHKKPTHMVIVDGPDRIARLWPEVQRLWGDKLEITASTASSIEFCAPGVNKGAALRWLVGTLGLGLEQVAAIGNERNDLSMITWAGLGGAVGNAPPAVREAAGVVVGDHDADGVAEFIDLWMERLSQQSRGTGG
ncbi:Cof-like hydrolase [Thermaerobacter marianensis DSM 12885]|uniref:Cof-like hydrolase n=2 Tax=Thermaerobacter marianensis TaxID=73919 RepID=E6SGS4_THEM7|nr:Cof-type HAD-IIB family hydrolase [Thermaerobacter marianensis]ADU51658.1 Cof-like hydrolase [Thermaerobacter marianensis DSM 12885]